MSNIPTPHKFLEAIQRNAFKDIDLTQLLTMDEDQQRIFTLEHVTPGSGHFVTLTSMLGYSHNIFPTSITPKVIINSFGVIINTFGQMSFSPSFC